MTRQTKTEGERRHRWEGRDRSAVELPGSAESARPWRRRIPTYTANQVGITERGEERGPFEERNCIQGGIPTPCIYLPWFFKGSGFRFFFFHFGGQLFGFRFFLPPGPGPPPPLLPSLPLLSLSALPFLLCALSLCCCSCVVLSIPHDNITPCRSCRTTAAPSSR